MLGGLRGQALEALQLALGLLPGVLGQARRLEALAQLLGLGRGLVHLAQLLLDRLELLAQEVLALALLHLGLHLRLDPAADLHQLELAREQLGEHRSRLATLRSSSSACFSSVFSRSAPAIMCPSSAGSSRLVTATSSSSGR